MITIAWAREDWAERVSTQAKQMRIIAAAANDSGMRDELLAHACSLETQADQILRRAS